MNFALARKYSGSIDRNHVVPASSPLERLGCCRKSEERVPCNPVTRRKSIMLEG